MHTSRHVAGAACAGALLITLVGCASGWDKSFFTLEDALTNPDNTTISNAHDDTDKLCSGISGCIEGWTTDQADFLRFDSNESALKIASTLGAGGYQSNRVVIDFERTLPGPKVRQNLIEGLVGIHSSE